MDRKLLIIEDNPDIVDLIEVFFVQYRWEVRIAPTIQKADAILKSYCPSLLITDVKLPDYDGVEFVKELRINKRLTDMKVIVITALTKGSKMSDQACKEMLQVDGFISKPFPLERLKRELISIGVFNG